MRCFLGAFCCTLALAGPAAADAPDTRLAKTERLRLDNGLTVIVRPVRGAKEVALVVLYGLGGDHDPKGQSGLAHLIEHLYITAAAGPAKARTARAFMEKYPRGWNAQTGDRYTVIATVFPPGDLDRELADAAARMGDLRITAGDLDREKPRVEQELANMFGGIPMLAAQNRARELAWPTPRGGRKGGVPAQVKAITLAAAQERWRRYYKPANAVLVLAGAVEGPAARKAVTAHFGKLAAGQKAPAPAAHGGPEFGKVRAEAVKPVGGQPGPEVCLAYRAPEPGSRLYPPFLVLAARLQAQAGKLRVGRNRFPVLYAFVDDPAVLLVSAPAQGKETPEQAAGRLAAFVAGPVKADLEAADVPRARMAFGLMLGSNELPESLVAGNTYGLAYALGRREQLGIDPAGLRKALAAVTNEDLRRAAREVFGPDRHAAVFLTVKK
jgi:zinc protease